MLNRELSTGDNQKIQLSTRIPESTNLKIEEVSGLLGIKKQEIISRLLDLGLSKIYEQHQPVDTSLLPDLPGTSLREVQKPTPHPFDSKQLVDLLEVGVGIHRCLENLSLAVVQNLVELKQILLEVSTSNLDSARVDSKAAGQNMPDTETRSDVFVTTELLQNQFSELQHLLSLKHQQILNRLNAVEQGFQELQQLKPAIISDSVLTPLEEITEISTSIETKSNDVQSRNENQQETTFTENGTLQTYLTLKGVSYFTLREAYIFAQAAGYSKPLKCFKHSLLTSKQSEKHQREWGIRSMVDLYRPVKGCRYIRLITEGKIAKAILASPTIIEIFKPSLDPISNSPCPRCNKRMHKNGSSNGKQAYWRPQCRLSRVSQSVG
jgi:hypothetical protein